VESLILAQDKRWRRA